MDETQTNGTNLDGAWLTRSSWAEGPVSAQYDSRTRLQPACVPCLLSHHKVHLSTEAFQHLFKCLKLTQKIIKDVQCKGIAERLQYCYHYSHAGNMKEIGCCLITGSGTQKPVVSFQAT